MTKFLKRYKSQKQTEELTEHNGSITWTEQEVCDIVKRYNAEISQLRTEVDILREIYHKTARENERLHKHVNHSETKVVHMFPDLTEFYGGL